MRRQMASPVENNSQ